MTLAAKHGPLTVVLEILEVIPGLRMVEFHKGPQGDAIDFYTYYATLLPLVGLQTSPAPSSPQCCLPPLRCKKDSCRWKVILIPIM